MSERDGAALDVLHIDMDCFFAAVEVIDRPELANRPVIVGGTADRGVVASASYEARAFGVHAAMPTALARRCCPEGVFVASNHSRYGEMNRRLLVVIDQVTPDYEPIAFDEAFIDVSGVHRLFGTSIEIAEHLRSAVKDELGLLCSVGIGRTKLIAKLASKSAKPCVYLGDGRIPVVEPGKGVHVVESDDEIEFLFGHPLRALPGIGPKTMARLNSLGISTIADASDVGRERLCKLLGTHQGGLIGDFIQGIDHRRVESQHDTRSIGHETTFSRDLYDRDELASRVREFATSVASRTRSSGLFGKTVTLKIRYRDLSIVTRSKSVNSPFTNASDIASVTSALLEGIAIDQGVRLLGVHLSNFVDVTIAGGEQLALFGAADEESEEASSSRQTELDEATDEIRRRFGEKSLESLAVIGRRPRQDPSPRHT